MSKFDMGAFAKTLQRSDVPDSGTGLREIPLDQISPNNRNFYPKVEEFDALMASIQANGLLEPLTVVENRGGHGGAYRIISGHNRWRCLNELHIQEPDNPRWMSAVCLVLPPMTEAQEMCAIIESNRQRKKTTAILQQEAEALTRAYAARKAAGEPLPGRVRDRVAADLGLPKTKLSNLDAIKNGLKVPGIIRKWEEDKIPEAAALEIARMDIDTQYRLVDWMIDNHRSYTIKEVQNFARQKAAQAAMDDDAAYLKKLEPFASWLVKSLGDVRSKAEGVETLKLKYRNSGIAGPNVDFFGTNRGLELDRLSKHPMERTWAQVWDLLSVLALRRFGDRAAALPQPDGQLCISGWMPGGTNPGPEAGRCAVLMDLGKAELHAKVLWWDGAKWLFKTSGPEAGLLPVWWMRLPPDPVKTEMGENNA